MKRKLESSRCLFYWLITSLSKFKCGILAVCEHGNYITTIDQVNLMLITTWYLLPYG